MSIEVTNSSVPHAITNARIITPDRVIPNGYLVIDEDRISQIGSGPPPAISSTIDANSHLVLPGLIDLHGDDLERHLFPRDGARINTETALITCDRENVASGITTKFHAIAFENSPDGDRSVTLANEIVDAIGSVDGLLGDNRVHSRCELGDDQAVSAVIRAIRQGVVSLVSLMNHLPQQGQFTDRTQFDKRYVNGRNCTEADAAAVIEDRKRVSSRQIRERISQVTCAARAAGINVASHDDETVNHVELMQKHGVSISEYPVTMAAAKHATRLGMKTAMGAPNVVRGDSLWGNLSARDAIQASVLDILCSDYHPFSLLESIFVATGDPVTRVARVTKHPADVLGLTDRGRIKKGARADLICVNPSSPPRVNRVFIGGSEVYSTS